MNDSVSLSIPSLNLASMQEILRGDYLDGDHMNAFHNILRYHTNFDPQNVFFINALEFVNPVVQPHIQILSSNPKDVREITHWICTYYDGSTVHIYDSLNLCRLSAEQHQYISGLFPYGPPVVYEKVQQQPNLKDCGVFAIAFAISIANGRNPIDEVYDCVKMRSHLVHIFDSKSLENFPVINSSVVQSDNLEQCASKKKTRGRPPKKQPQAKVNESLEERRNRLNEDKAKERNRKSKNVPTPEKQMRLTKDRERKSILLSVQKTPEKTRRLSKAMQYKSAKIDSTPERQKRRNEENISKKRRRDAEKTPERCQRLNALKEGNRKRKANETTPEKISRRSNEAERKREKRTNESLEDRLKRLENVRDSDARKKKRTAETVLGSPAAEVDEFYCGQMNVRCSSCGSKNFSKEKPTDGQFNICCQKGKIDLHYFRSRPFPQFLERLMTNKDKDSKNFLENIRSFNSSFSFASMGAQIAAPKGYGPYCFRIHGQIYHRAVTLHPTEGQQRKYAQLYILDPGEATRQRLRIAENSECNRSVMDRIGKFMNEQNVLAKAYRNLHEVELEERAKALRKGVTPTEVSMAIRFDGSSDRRRYNDPSCDEVAVVFQNKDGEPPFERDLIIYLKPTTDPGSKRMERISILHPCLEPMTYPLLFPFGDSGWHPNIPMKGSSKRLTQMDYYGFRLAVRDDFNPFLNAGKLTQQFIVDAYVKMESNRLRWIRQHQKDLHTESYQGLMDHLHSEAAEKGVVAGKPVILPSTFIGSPRNMHQNYQDAMSIVRKFGKPDLFLTMTCNPRWREITENLEPHQRVEHRPDLVARVFDLKLKELMNDICDKNVLGKVVAKVHVIEFQKRGLPHAHMLIILADEDKPREPEDIDKLVSAEIPDPKEHPRLHELVLAHMVHGPCGTPDSHSPCMDDGKCTKDFPKPFQDETIGNLNGYPRYRRRNTGKTYKVRNKDIDNRWIVPFMAYLLLKYNCHINIEVCATIKSVKYLFKYVYKGHDCANIAITESSGKKELIRDEVKLFLDSRYVSAPEAVWRIFGKSMHGRSHNIVRLAVHLPNHHSVCFNKNDNAREILNAATTKFSTLSAWFKLNEDDPSARKYLYVDIPGLFVFDKKDGWRNRERGGSNVIGRMYTVSIGEGERYFLRLLLLHVRGATSFENLRTVNGVTFKSFQEAALELGLLEDDSVWEATLADGAAMAMPKSFRELFALICVFGCPLSPKTLWEKFVEELTEDISRKHNSHVPGCELCENLALREIENILILHGKTCANFGLRSPPKNLPNAIEEVFNAQEEEVLGKNMLDTLNPQQRFAFDVIFDTIYAKKDKSNCFFLDGPGGSGKTYLYKALMSVIRGKGDVVLPVASTGIAANLLKGGRTYFSQFKLPVPLLETSTSNMRMSSPDAETLRKAKLIIWDEAPMAPSYALDAIDRLLKSIMQNDHPFGSKVILLGGDFRQCLPVVPHAHRAAIVQTSIKYSSLWPEFKTLRLATNVRCVDPEYSAWLLKVGNGELLNSDGLEEDLIEIPETIIAKDNIVKEIFGTSLKASDVSGYANKTILCSKNEDAAVINEKVLELLDGELTSYFSVDSVDCEDESETVNYPVEFLNSLNPSGMPPHKLNLKIGAIVMLLRNLNVKKGLCNGTRLVVTNLAKNLITGTVLTGTARGTTAFIPRIVLAPNDPDIPFVLRRRQFPIKLSFAMSINKSQGQTMDEVGIYLPRPVFSHGQLYVAFSRVRCALNVKVEVKADKSQGHLIQDSDKLFTKNIVYKEVL